MPVPPPRRDLTDPLRRQLEALDGLPLRPATVRSFLAAHPDDPDQALGESGVPAARTPATEIDPGWVLGRARWGGALDPLRLIAARPWWLPPSGPAAEALGRLWRHAVAVGLAAVRLARDAGADDPERVARAGLLHGLGRWAVAAVDPEWLARWFEEPDPRQRIALERRALGVEMSSLGRALAERWGCDPLVADAAWLHADPVGGLNACASDPRRLAMIQEAYAWAERTPWALSDASRRQPPGSDPRLRVLVAEVQVRCGAAFIEPDATPHEERLARSNARLRGRLSGLLAERASRDGLIRAMSQADPSRSPASWAEQAGLAWCGLPGVATARVVWTGQGASAQEADEASGPGRPPAQAVRLVDRGRPCAEIQLWPGPDGVEPLRPDASVVAAWQSWAALVADRARLEGRLETVLGAYRERLEEEEPRVRRLKLDALAEFAAGAGHELNNPLAVIVGRAQLLLARETDPEAARSLRAILGQAQRAHRILRDLMFVARTPEPRTRPCLPDEILRASLRDLRPEADARGVRLVADEPESSARAWADPDALRHVADLLVRNALESTAKGGTIHVAASGDAQSLRWSVRDNGRGVGHEEGEHLFDPFYCGRQAGRGLGLGLPRAARIVAQAGGELRWHSTPGQGSLFQVHLPLSAPPRPPTADSEDAAASPRDRNSLPHS